MNDVEKLILSIVNTNEIITINDCMRNIDNLEEPINVLHMLVDKKEQYKKQINFFKKSKSMFGKDERRYIKTIKDFEKTLKIATHLIERIKNIYGLSY